MMKRVFLMTFVMCFVLSPLANAEKWVQVTDGKIVRWQQADETDTLKQAKLEAHGYIPVVEEPVPEYDWITEKIADGYRIEKERVVRYYTVTDRDLAEAKQVKTDVMKQKALVEIEAILSETITAEDVEPILTKIKAILTEIAGARTNDELKEVDYEAAVISK